MASVLLISAVLFGSINPSRGQAQSLLGTAESFAVLGGSTVTNTGATIVQRNLGVSPGTAVTGFPPGIVTGGTIHAANAVASQAQSDVTSAYNSLAGRPCDFVLTGQDLGGLTLVPGVYCFSTSAQLTGRLTLNAQGNSAALFVFKIGSTLTTASNSSVGFINGSSCNVFWQIGSSATLGTGTSFVGNILALSSISLTTGARINGRALARNGAVTMDTNTVSAAACSSAPPVPTATTVPETPTPETPAATEVPATATPETPAPGTSTPVTPAPATSTPATPGTQPSTPVVPGPIGPGPETPTPVAPAPLTPTPVNPGGESPTPGAPGPGTPTPATPVGPGTSTPVTTGTPGIPVTSTPVTPVGPGTSTPVIPGAPGTPTATQTPTSTVPAWSTSTPSATATPVTIVRFPDTGTGGFSGQSNQPGMIGSIVLGIASVMLLTGGLGIAVQRRRRIIE